MAALIPPTPLNAPMNSDVWNRWLETVRQIINSSAVGVVWDNINFAGSNLSDLAVREHNTLQAIQGGAAGDYYHITNAERGRILSATQFNRATSVISAAVDPSTSDIAASQWAIYKNTTSGDVKLWANDGGTMKSVLLM